MREGDLLLRVTTILFASFFSGSDNQKKQTKQKTDELHLCYLVTPVDNLIEPPDWMGCVYILYAIQFTYSYHNWFV